MLPDICNSFANRADGSSPWLLYSVFSPPKAWIISWTKESTHVREVNQPNPQQQQQRPLSSFLCVIIFFFLLLLSQKNAHNTQRQQDLEAHFKAKGKEVTHETIEEFAWETLNSGKVRWLQ